MCAIASTYFLPNIEELCIEKISRYSFYKITEQYNYKLFVFLKLKRVRRYFFFFVNLKIGAACGEKV